MLPLKKRLDERTERLHVGWEGYIRHSAYGTVWKWCRIVGWDEGAPIVRTRQGYYHRKPLTDFDFYLEPPQGAIVRK